MAKPSLSRVGKGTAKGHKARWLSLGPAGLPEPAELVTDECRRAGAAGLLYPHGRPRAGRQRAPGPVLIVRICGRGHEGAQRAAGLPIPEALDVTLWERRNRCESATADPCPESYPGRRPQPAPSQAWDPSRSSASLGPHHPESTALRPFPVPCLIKIHTQDTSPPPIRPLSGGQALGLLGGDQPWGRPSPAWTESNTLFSPLRLEGRARGAHRGEDISIEALDGHWPTPISRVRGPRPRRSPRASRESPWGSLFAPLLLAFFLLPNPHQLHTSALPADDHCEGWGRAGSQRPMYLISPKCPHPFLPGDSRPPDSPGLKPLLLYSPGLPLAR